MTFVKTIPLLPRKKKKLFGEYKESVWKDVDRDFGVLQAWFASVRGPTRLMKEEEIDVIIRVCLILQNLIVEDEWNNY